MLITVMLFDAKSDAAHLIYSKHIKNEEDSSRTGFFKKEGRDVYKLASYKLAMV